MDLVKAFIENIGYPLMEKRRGNRTRQYLDELKRSQTLPPEKLVSLQRKRLEKLLEVCAREVPAYRSDGPRHSLMGKWRNIPPLGREELQKNPDAYLAESARREDLIPSSSGGSTGTPVKFYLDRYTVEHYEAARWRGLSWWGITPGSRSVMLWCNPVDLKQMSQSSHQRREKWLKNRIVISAQNLSGQTLPKYVGIIDRYRPEYIYGYASALYALAGLMEKEKLSLRHPPKLVLSTSEMLFDFQREAIGKAFGCPVADEYGAKDAGILAFECPKGRMHISCENALLEVLDPETLNPLPIGERGLLAVTDLNNLVMPRLRYLLGDMASLSSDVCGCGLTLPVMGSVEGRQSEMFVTVDDRLVHSLAFVRLARVHQSVAQFQIIQHAPESATLRVVRNDDARVDDLGDFVLQARGLLPGTDIEVLTVDVIPPTASGKACYALREFPLPGARREETEEEEGDTNYENHQ